MADFGDEASVINEQWRDACLKNFASRAEQYKRVYNDGDSWTCAECADEIPELRMKAGFINCVSCQEDIEEDERVRQERRL